MWLLAFRERGQLLHLLHARIGNWKPETILATPLRGCFCFRVICRALFVVEGLFVAGVLCWGFVVRVVGWGM